MAYGDLKNLQGRTVSDRLCSNKAFNAANNLEYDGYKQRLTPMVHKPVIRKMQKHVYSSFYGLQLRCCYVCS